MRRTIFGAASARRADHKERGRRVGFFQGIQQGRGLVGVGAVVKGNGDLFARCVSDPQAFGAGGSDPHAGRGHTGRALAEQRAGDPAGIFVVGVQSGGDSAVGLRIFFVAALVSQACLGPFGGFAGGAQLEQRPNARFQARAGDRDSRRRARIAHLHAARLGCDHRAALIQGIRADNMPAVGDIFRMPLIAIRGCVDHAGHLAVDIKGDKRGDLGAGKLGIQCDIAGHLGRAFGGTGFHGPFLCQARQVHLLQGDIHNSRLYHQRGGFKAGAQAFGFADMGDTARRAEIVCQQGHALLRLQTRDCQRDQFLTQRVSRARCELRLMQGHLCRMDRAGHIAVQILQISQDRVGIVHLGRRQGRLFAQQGHLRLRIFQVVAEEGT